MAGFRNRLIEAVGAAGRKLGGNIPFVIVALDRPNKAIELRSNMSDEDAKALLSFLVSSFSDPPAADVPDLGQHEPAERELPPEEP